MDSNDYNDNGYNSNNGLGYKSPSFSNDIANIKNRIDSGRAEQKNNRQGLSKENDNNSSKGGNELPKKDNLDKKDDLDKKDNLDKKDGDSKKDKSDAKGKGDKKGGISDLASKKGDINPLNKFKSKLKILKVKIIIIGVCIFFGMAVTVGILAGIAGVLGAFSGDHVDPENINEDKYDYDNVDDPDELIEIIDQSYVEEEEEESTETPTEETIIERETEDNKPDNAETE